MKLLACRYCSDVRALHVATEPLRCRCGRAWGHYLPPDGERAVAGGTALILGLPNGILKTAVARGNTDDEHKMEVFALSLKDKSLTMHPAEKTCLSDPELATEIALAKTQARRTNRRRSVQQWAALLAGLLGMALAMMTLWGQATGRVGMALGGALLLLALWLTALATFLAWLLVHGPDAGRGSRPAAR